MKINLQSIHQQKHLLIWVPERFGGLNLSFSKGLQLLMQLAEQNGSLGWLVTLCSGANYFSRNLRPAIANQLFAQSNVCFGGSGVLAGTAEKQGNQYLINGTWRYATGAPHLTHFTLNAQIVENGELLTNVNGDSEFLSFVLPASQVNIIEGWQTMGLKETVSHSFEVKNQLISEDYAFQYNKFHSNEVLDKIPFTVFADLTLLVNYLGMAKHFALESLKITGNPIQQVFLAYIEETTAKTQQHANEIEKTLSTQNTLEEAYCTEIHQFGEDVVTKLIEYISKLYPLLGMRVADENEEINEIYRDFFTATQHKNFRVFS